MDSKRIDETSVRLAAAAIDLEIAPEHLPGVVHYTRMVADFAAIVSAFPLDETIEPAAIFTPCQPPTQA